MPDLSVWVNILAGVFISAVYVVIGLRIWQRRSRQWSILGLATALVYVWPTAHYIWEAFQGRVDVRPPNYLFLALVTLPALLVLQIVRWSFQDEADAANVITSIGEE